MADHLTAYGPDRPQRPQHPDFPPIIAAALWADSHTDFDTALASLGIDAAVVAETAMQRSPTILKAASNHPDDISDTRTQRVLISAWVDGFATGAHLPDRGDGEPASTVGDIRRIQTADRRRTMLADMTSFHQLLGTTGRSPLGADPDTVRYLARQRALRTMQLLAGSPLERQAPVCWLDGIVVGLRFQVERAELRPGPG